MARNDLRRRRGACNICSIVTPVRLLQQRAAIRDLPNGDGELIVARMCPECITEMRRCGWQFTD